MNHQNEDWLRTQVEVLGRTSQEIANECGVTKQNIRYFAKKFGLKTPNPPHTRKGTFLAERSPLWRGGKAQYVCNWSAVAEQFKRLANYTCNNCGKHPKNSSNIHVNHIDGDKKNNVPANIEVLCRSCHNLKHPERYANR
jgi:5-methylcytosine-specific restriction endonuclease McrA